MLQWALDRKARQSRVPVDLSRAYWTPRLRPQIAFEVERNQIETVLGVAALVALTDHDTIEAPAQLRSSEETREIPFSLEGSVPYEDAIFHLGSTICPPAGRTRSSPISRLPVESIRRTPDGSAGHAA